MNWNEAVWMASQGHSMRRKSEAVTSAIGEIDLSGQEGFRLMHAWTEDNKPVTVFIGAWSKCLFVPDDEHRAATDWEIEE